MEHLLQSSLLSVFVLLSTLRFTSAMPAILGLTNSNEVTASKEHHHRHHRTTTSGTTELETLHRELHRVTRELAQTKETINGLKAQMEQNLNNYSSPSSSNMRMSCRTTFTVWHETVGKTLEYLDNFDVHCQNDEFLRQWRMTWGERGKKKAIKFVCCKFIPSAETRWQH